LPISQNIEYYRENSIRSLTLTWFPWQHVHYLISFFSKFSSLIALSFHHNSPSLNTYQILFCGYVGSITAFTGACWMKWEHTHTHIHLGSMCKERNFSSISGWKEVSVRYAPTVHPPGTFYAEMCPALMHSAALCQLDGVGVLLTVWQAINHMWPK
jgi:hypothetical protein